MRLPTLQLGRIRGIPIELRPTWFIALLAVTGVLTFAFLPELLPERPVWVRAAVAGLSALAMFASLVTHEFSHAMVAHRVGVHVHRVTLFLFGGVAQLGEEPREPSHELALAVAGPAMSVALCAAFAGAGISLQALSASDVVWVPLQYLALVNLAIAVFNLLPGYPMDGGRVLHAYLWWASGDRFRATWIASWLGVALGALIVLGAAWLTVTGELAGVWPMLLGVFLMRLARDGFVLQAPGLRAGRIDAGSIAQRPLPTADASAPAVVVAESAREAGLPAVVVVRDGQVVGVLPSSPAAVGVSAGDAAVRDPLLFVDAAESLGTVLRRFTRGAPAVVVVSAGRAIGLAVPRTAARAAT
jgi:Zn-dependent protease